MSNKLLGMSSIANSKSHRSKLYLKYNVIVVVCYRICCMVTFCTINES